MDKQSLIDLVTKKISSFVEKLSEPKELEIPSTKEDLKIAATKEDVKMDKVTESKKEEKILVVADEAKAPVQETPVPAKEEVVIPAVEVAVPESPAPVVPAPTVEAPPVEVASEKKEDISKIFEKISAHEYMKLEEYIMKKAKGDVKDIQRYPESEINKHKQTIEPGLKDSHESDGSVKDIARHTEKEYASGVDAQTKNVEPGLQSKTDKGHKAIENNTLKVAEEVKKQIFDKVASELEKSIVAKLYRHSLNKIIAKVVSETVDSSGDEELKKSADLIKEAASDYYYYFSKTKADEITKINDNTQTPHEKPGDPLVVKKDSQTPSEKPVDTMKVEKGTQTPDNGAPKDVATVAEGTQTPSEAPKSSDKGEAVKAGEAVAKRVEKENTIEDTKKKMGFTAEFIKGEKLSKNSSWIVKNTDGKIVLKASLENIWQTDVEKELPAFEKEDFVLKYKAALEQRIQETNIDEVAKLLSTEIITEKVEVAPVAELKTEAAALNPKELEVIKLCEEIEDALGIQESPAEEKKESKLPFVEQVLEEVKEIHKTIIKKPETKKPEAPKKLEAPKLEAPKAAPKIEEKKEEIKPPKISKSQRELELESQLMTFKAEASLKEKTLKCKALVEEMVRKDLIQPDEEVIKVSQLEGQNLFDAKKLALKKAVDDQMTEFFKMDDMAFKAFEKSIKRIQKTASKDVKDNSLTQIPVVVTDPVVSKSTDEWFKQLPWS